MSKYVKNLITDDLRERFKGIQDALVVSVAGLDANKAVVIPGLPNRMASAFGWLSPRGMLVPMLAKRHPALRP